MDCSGNPFLESATGAVSAVMPSGLPKKLEDLLPLEDSVDHVYKNVSVMSRANVHHSSFGVKVSSYDSATSFNKFSFESTKLVPLQKPAPFEIRRFGKFHVVLNESEQMASQLVVQFFVNNHIQAVSKIESDIHYWKCYNIINAQLLKFNVYLYPQGEGTVVEFKRDECDQFAFQELFLKFQRICGQEPKVNPRGRMVSLPLDDDGPNSDDTEQAISAYSAWLNADAEEAFQSIGQMSLNKSVCILRSDNLLADICNAVERQSNSDLMMSSLSMACLRAFMQQRLELGVSCALTAEQVNSVAKTVIRSAKSNDVCAQKEAFALVEVINPNATLDNRIVL